MENERSPDGFRPPSNKYSCPWLMISHSALEQQTFYNILEDRSYCANMIPDILHKFPISTNQPGWVLVQGDRSSFPDVEEEEEDGIDDEEDDDDNTDDDDGDEDGDGDEVHEFAQEEDGGGGEENDHAGDGDAHADEAHNDGEEDNVGDGDEFGHGDGNEVHEFDHDNDFGSAYAAEECDDGSKVVCFLWNINSSSEKIPITDYKGVGDTTSYYDHCLLSSSPSESDCIIYLFKETSVFFGRLSGHKLSHRVISMSNYNEPICGAVIVENGKVMCIFGLGIEVVIGTPVYREGWCLDLTRYTIDATDFPLGTICSYPYFIEYQGEVIFVRMSTYGEDYYNQVHSFWLYRFNFYKKTWEPLDDIGQTAIFISADSYYPARFGIRCNVSDEDEKKGLIPNSIYFTYNSKFIYVFSIENQTISYFCPCPIVIDYHSQWVLF